MSDSYSDPVESSPLPQPSEYAEPAAEVPPVSAEPEERRYPSTVGGAVYLLVLAGALIGLGVVAAGSWRKGITWLSVSLLVAAGTRLALPESSAGMLRVRNRYLDAVILGGMGVVMLVLAWTIPDQPG